MKCAQAFDGKPEDADMHKTAMILEPNYWLARFLYPGSVSQQSPSSQFIYLQVTVKDLSMIRSPHKLLGRPRYEPFLLIPMFTLWSHQDGSLIILSR